MNQHDEIVLQAGQSAKHYWKDLFRYRELFYVLAWRDISVRYKQTAIGVAWALIRPFLTMVVLTIVFGRIADLPSDGDAPYELLVMTGLLPWTLFSTALSEASNSLISNANLIGKVYFPRMIVPTAAVITALIDFLIGIAMLFAMMWFYQVAPSWRVCLLPLCAILVFFASLGPGLCATALNVRFRDFRYVIPFIVQFGLYISPVGFSSHIASEKWRFFGEWRPLYYLNPIAGVIDCFRWCILGEASPLYFPGLCLSMLVIVFFLWLGINTFRSMERSFADII